MKFKFPDGGEVVDATLAILLVGIAMLPVVFQLIAGSIPEYLLNEDGLYEKIAAYVCLLTFAFLIYPIVQIGKGNKLGLFWLLCFAISMLVIGGEEISWVRGSSDSKRRRSLRKTISSRNSTFTIRSSFNQVIIHFQ